MPSKRLISAAELSTLLSKALHVPLHLLSDDLEMRDSGAWDSLTHIELIATLEDDLGLELSDDEIVTMTGVGAIKRILREKGVLVG